MAAVIACSNGLSGSPVHFKLDNTDVRSYIPVLLEFISLVEKEHQGSSEHASFSRDDEGSSGGANGGGIIHCADDEGGDMGGGSVVSGGSLFCDADEWSRSRAVTQAVGCVGVIAGDSFDVGFDAVVSERTLRNRRRRVVAKERKQRKQAAVIDPGFWERVITERESRRAKLEEEKAQRAAKLEEERIARQAKYDAERAQRQAKFEEDRARRQAEMDAVLLEKQKHQENISKIFAEKQRLSLQTSKEKDESVLGAESVVQSELKKTWEERKIAENKVAKLRAEQQLKIWDHSEFGLEERRKAWDLRSQYQATSLGKKMADMRIQTAAKERKEWERKQAEWAAKVTGTPSATASSQGNSVWSGDSLGSSPVSPSACSGSVVPEEYLIEEKRKTMALEKEIETMKAKSVEEVEGFNTNMKVANNALIRHLEDLMYQHGRGDKADACRRIRELNNSLQKKPLKGHCMDGAVKR